MARIWLHFNTLRFKLTFLYTIVFGLLLISLAGAIVGVRERDLTEQFDERLRDRVEVIVDEIVVPSKVSDDGQGFLPSRGRVNPFRFPGYFFQIRLADENVVYRSANLEDHTLPMTGAARGHTSSYSRSWLSEVRCLFLCTFAQEAKRLNPSGL